MRVTKYFAYSHLPDFLQKVSKPFADCINEINSESADVFKKEESVFDTIEKVSEMLTNDTDETSVCIQKLHNVIVQIYNRDLDAVIRLILEAKDCAVRAALPD
jgi:hypothetical protein